MFSSLKKYPQSFRLFFAIVLAIVLFGTGALDFLVLHLGKFGYISATIAGFLFSFTLTATTAALYFVELGFRLNPVIVVILGGFGAMFADLLMYRFFQHGILAEVKLFFAEAVPTHHRERLERLTQHRVFIWGIPFLASILIASPLPDELGLGLFGLINFKPKYLSLLTFILNGLGILALVYLGHSI